MSKTEENVIEKTKTTEKGSGMKTECPKERKKPSGFPGKTGGLGVPGRIRTCGLQSRSKLRRLF